MFFVSVISAKAYMNQPSLLSSICSEIMRNTPAKTVVFFVFRGGALFVFLELVLGRSFISASGEASGFCSDAALYVDCYSSSP